MTSRPFLSRLILPFAVLIVLIVSASGVVIYLIGNQAVRGQQLKDLNHLTVRLRDRLATEGDQISPATERQVAEFVHLLNARLTLIDGDGKVVIDTAADIRVMPNHNDRPEVIAARKTGSSFQTRFSHTIQEDSMYVADLVDPARPGGYVLRLSYPRSQWATLDVPVWAIVAGGAALTLISIAAFSFILNRQWIAPVRRLAVASEKLAAGDWQTRVEPAGADDLRFFSTRLNQVALNLQKQLQEMRIQRGDLQAVVDTLPDPILLTDPQRRILLINAPGARLLEVSPDQAIGKTPVSFVSDEAILELFEYVSPSADNSPDQLHREIRLTRSGQRLTYQTFVTRTDGGGVLVMLRDVTALSNAVQMKTDFVANASHELRTPIAAIKIAFETLQDVYADDPEQTSKCVGVIAGHLQRLEDMLRDLLDLSSVERPDLRATAGRVSAADLFGLLRSSMGPMAQRKLVELKFEERPSHAEFMSDERLLNLVLKNLVENSIKYTPSGGSVTVSVEIEPTEVLVKVSDTGIGIPQEHLDRVFERFYQVNAARTGSSGRGTGLGLAIVKHAINGLNGSVRLESTVGVGTTVACALPQGSPARA